MVRQKGHPNGSSPRGQGTRVNGNRKLHTFVNRKLHTSEKGAGVKRARFIPARAGNAPFSPTGIRISPVHPRAGGERGRVAIGMALLFGSSPRGRGTRPRHDLRDHLPRFIPARAGNAQTPPARRPPTPVHPRAGGERLPSPGDTLFFHGSSPRGRGTRSRSSRPTWAKRFIPARAGNALSA